MDLKQLQSAFPSATNQLYLDTAAAGMLSQLVIKNWEKTISRWKEKGPLSFNEIADRIERMRSCFSHDMGLGPGDELVFLPNFSVGLNMLLESMPENLKVAYYKNDYPSVTQPLLFRNRYKSFPVDLFSSDLPEKLQRESIDVLLYSTAQYITGKKVTEKQIDSIKDLNPHIILVADTTQYIGTEPYIFQDSRNDIIIGSGYKWITGGFGNGYLIFKEDIIDQLDIKWTGSNDKFRKDHMNIHYKTGGFEPGHIAWFNMDNMVKGYHHLFVAGLENVAKHNQNLRDKMISLLKGKGYEHLLETDDESSYAPILSLKVPEEIQVKLEEENVKCSYRNGLRLSFHIYNTLEEMHLTAEKLLKLLNNHLDPRNIQTA